MKQRIPHCLLLVAVMIISGIPTFAQRKSAMLNHIALYVYNLEKSTAFYRDIIQIDTIPEPFHDGRHTWFKVAEHSHLHIISGAKEIVTHDKNSHLCFSVPSIEEFMTRLRQHHIPFESWKGEADKPTLRVDGVKQIYFTDPDGYWVEINDDHS
ncbi:VOC family protein [Chitinophaga ginsengisoli]|uniref:Lactoylglutathione lyase n=1 Tax=Chitinophaga ginsengisoli TaxID=363837 RepID=A0A2P8FGK3_9BACT|nr:VOC family protein [Chitinophaga ginsengisoli]PSL20853.1 lactoylglutathione lyase [Chitinophaga ginsengisoli]